MDYDQMLYDAILEGAEDSDLIEGDYWIEGDLSVIIEAVRDAMSRNGVVFYQP
jgi:hypothetical protein